jgi:hypothetical protein
MTKSEAAEFGLVPAFIVGIGLLFDLPESVSLGCFDNNDDRLLLFN